MTSTIPAIVPLDREGLLAHLDALADILHACVHDGASVGFVLPFDTAQARAYWLGKVAPALEGGRRTLLVAKMAHAVCGTIQLDTDTWPNQSHRADVSKLLVHPRHRRAGLGRRLMQHVEAAAAAAGRHLLTLDTAGDAAERLYLSLGYERAGTIPGYARHPTDDRLEATILMFKRLATAL